MFGVTSERTLTAYFLAAANIFEPNRSAERLLWARTSVVAQDVSQFFKCNGCNDSTKEIKDSFTNWRTMATKNSQRLDLHNS